METKQITVTELTKKTLEVKGFMNEFIDFLINNYKIQSIREWERNHSISDKHWKDKITELSALKRDLTESLSKELSFHDEITVKLELQLEVKNKSKRSESQQMKVSA